jgi:hypothetical protein
MKVFLLFYQSEVAVHHPSPDYQYALALYKENGGYLYTGSPLANLPKANKRFLW